MKNKLFLSALAMMVATPALVQTAQAMEMQNTDVRTSSITFSDVPTSFYVHDQIMTLVQREVIKGFGDGTFKPFKEVTRAEFAAFVARSLDLPSAQSNFKDVPKSAALYDGVSRAYAAGIIKGFGDGTFKPTVPVNRLDMAVMVDRAMQIKGSYTNTKALDFSDKTKVGAYAKQSVERLYYYNVMGALSGNSFSGTTIGTRAETARYIYNMLQVLDGTFLEPTPPIQNENPQIGDVVVLKGIKFTFNGLWTDEYGSSHGKLPSKDPKAEIKMGIKYSYRTNASNIGTSALLTGYLIEMDLNFTRDEFLNIINQVSNTGKDITSKGIRFYLPDSNDKTHIQFTLI